MFNELFINMINFTDTQPSVGSNIIQGLTASFFIFIQNTLLHILPYLVISLFIIISDIFFGIRAAMKRGEQIRLSRAIRRTISKIFEYVCFIIIGCTIAIAFNSNLLEYLVVGGVFLIEGLSMLENFCFVKGIRIKGIKSFLVKLFKKRGNIDIEDIEIEKEDRDSIESKK